MNRDETPNLETVQILPSEGWRRVYLVSDEEEHDGDTLPNGYAVSYSPVACWALLRDRETGEMCVSGLAPGYAMLNGTDYKGMPERTVGFIGYLGPEESPAALEHAAEFIAGEEEVIGHPWVKEG